LAVGRRGRVQRTSVARPQPPAPGPPAGAPPTPRYAGRVLDRLALLENEYETVLIQLSDPAVISDQHRLREASKRHKELEAVVMAYREYRRVASDLATAREMLADIMAAPYAPSSPTSASASAGNTENPGPGALSIQIAADEDRAILRQEIETAEARLDELDSQLKLLLLPKDPNDGKNVIMEIRGAEGGEEANLFARDLYEMYLRYVERKGLTMETLSADPSDMGGFNQVTFLVKGDTAWSSGFP
jgi:peptide chain release factor 1